MLQTTLEKAAFGSRGTLYVPETAQIPVSGISTDSRTVQKSNLYIPLIGARADGHDYLDSAVNNGAAASLWQKDHTPYPENVPLILVDDTLEAMQNLAKFWLAEVNPVAIGITGSNGKTSTKDMTAAILSRLGKTQKTQGNHNNEIGLPMTILDLDADTKYAVLEMGMENFGEIAFLCSIAPLDAAIITTIGSAHLENLGSRLNIARAKAEIIDGLHDQGILVYIKESCELQQAMQEKEIPEGVRTVAFGEGTDWSAQNIHVSRDGLSFETDPVRGEISLPCLGEFQISNALASMALAKNLGATDEMIIDGLKDVELTPMRGQIVRAGETVIVDDSYKSNPEGAKAALDMLMSVPGSRHVALLADMLDLGRDSASLHAQVGEYAKEIGVDELLAYGPESVHTVDAFGEGGYHFETREDLTEKARDYLQPHYVLLAKGSRAMSMDKTVRELAGQGD